MNVRERAKNYEAFMSSSSSTEREKKKSREETMEKSAPVVSDNKKMAGGEKAKPVPPPRKRKLPERPDKGPQLQHRSTCTTQVKSSLEVSSKISPSTESENPKPQKKPPPRPAPYKQPLSPSLASKVPQPRTIHKTPPSTIRDASNVPSPDTPKTSSRENPKRPPPPTKTSSLPRKQKPPVPPKPKRNIKTRLSMEKEKSATLPKTGSISTNDIKSCGVEKNIDVVTKAERSLTGPLRISIEKSDKTEEIQDNSCSVENGTKLLEEEEEETSHRETVKPGTNVTIETVQEPEEEKNPQEQQSSDGSPNAPIKDLSKDDEISNGASQEGDKENRTLENEILRDNKESKTDLKEDILGISDEQMEIEKNDIRYEQSFEGKLHEIEKVNMMKDDDGIDVDFKDEDREREEVPIKTIDKDKDNLNNSNCVADVLSETPDLSMEVEEDIVKNIQKTEGNEDDAIVERTSSNSFCEDVNLEKNQSLSDGDMTNVNQQETPFGQNSPVDIVVDSSTEENVELNDQKEVSTKPLVQDAIVCEDDVPSIEKPMSEQVPREEDEAEAEQVNISEDHTGVGLLPSQVATVGEENPIEQARPEAITVVEGESDVSDTEQIQQQEADAIVEAIPIEEPADNATHEQDDCVLEVGVIRENEGDAAVTIEKDTTKLNNEITNIEEKNEEEGMEGTVDDADRRQNKEVLADPNIQSFCHSEETVEDEILPQDEVKVASVEESQSGETETAMDLVQEELSSDADHHVEASSGQDVPIDTESENQSLTEDIVSDKDAEVNIKEPIILTENGEKAEEETPESVSQNENPETTTSKLATGDIEVDQNIDPFNLDEPIRPRRPSRLRKLAKNGKKNSEITAETKLAVETHVEKISIEEKPNYPKTLSGRSHENVILDVSSKEDVKAERDDDTLLESSEDSGQRFSKKPDPGYENVILRTEDNNVEEIAGSESPSIYEVPRRRSFHSHTSEKKMVRRIQRSSSIGSLEPEAESEYKVPKPRSKTVAAEEIYVVPRWNSPASTSSETEETYVVPKTIRPASPIQASPISESEYHVPQSLVREESTEAEYKVPSRIRSPTDGSEEEEAVYSVPTSPRGTKVGQPSGSEEEEAVYSVPTPSVSVPRGTQVETQRQPSESEEEGMYSVPNTPVSATKESEPTSDVNYPDEEPFKRTSRSSVITSRKQLKDVPPKPPRASIIVEAENRDKDNNTLQQNEGSKPVPIPRTIVGATKQSPEVKPRVIPRPKPRNGQDDFTEKKIEDEFPAPSPPKDQSQSSPKPKRPAPPRPKVPTVSSATENGMAVHSEDKKQAAPPRPPPPSVNRTSFAPSEQESVSSIPGFPSESSESESEEEIKPPEPTGPLKKKTYHIAHEIRSTERTFVKALSLCYEDCYGLIRNAEVVPEATLNDIFKDLGNIYQLDGKFLQELEERMETWDEHERIGDIVKKYGHFLKMYTTYINNYDKAMHVLQETTKENPQFAELVQQFQASEKCKGLFLISFMLKPVQRIPSYRLLLKDYLKHLTPDSDEFKDIQVALEIVSEVATHINESMNKADNFERVLTIQESIVGNAEIVKPGRDLIKEGVLKKLCRKDMQERTFFLLTDVLLYTAPVGNTQYKLKEKLPILGMKVTLPESPDFENEFNIISKMRSFTLSASTPSERDEWIEELNKAISAVTKKKSTFLMSKAGTIAKPEEEEESKLGEKAPVWIPDARVTMCMLCTDNFTVTNRRHHCRSCGKVVCGSCSDNVAPLAYLDYVQARVCEVCYDFLLKEQNKSQTTNYMECLPVSPVGMSSEDLERIHRKPPKFEILHRFKSSNRAHRRKSKAFRSVCTEVVGHESGSQMSGYLKFKRTNRQGWKRLWFVLKDNVLYTYKASEDVVAIETIPILGYNVQEATRTEGDEIQFQLKHAGLPPITFKTESESSVSRWIQELKKATTL